MAELTGDQIEFTNAFNRQRGILAGFAKCANQDELHIVRDGLYFGLATDLGFAEGVRAQIVTSNQVASAVGGTNAFQEMIKAARESPGWEPMVAAVKARAALVECDLDGIWMTLEKGRLDWLAAASGAHKIKTTLKEGLQKDKEHTEGDVSDAKMIWMYAIARNLPSLKENVVPEWQKVVKMADGSLPLKDYQAELWDPRKQEWAPLDTGVQIAAEQGGSSISEAWDM